MNMDVIIMRKINPTPLNSFLALGFNASWPLDIKPLLTYSITPNCLTLDTISLR